MIGILPLFAQINQLWYALPLIVSVSLVYAATRHEYMEPILGHAIRFGAWIGGFMLATVALRVYQSRHRTDAEQVVRTQCPATRRTTLIAGVVGFPAGLLAGLLGIGGGIWAVPSQNMGLGVRLRNAIANSACMIVFVAIGAAIVQSVAVERMSDLRAIDGWSLTLFLAPGALLGGWIGAGLTHRIPTGGLRLAVNLLLAAAGLRLLLG